MKVYICYYQYYEDIEFLGGFFDVDKAVEWKEERKKEYRRSSIAGHFNFTEVEITE
jgi:hypothetical protein